MNFTAIEWCDYTHNPVTGCRNACEYCYARRIARRFAGGKAFPNGFEPTFHRERLMEPRKKRKAAKIFVCSMGELFGPWVPDDWVNAVVSEAATTLRHTFQFLTKCPERLRTIQWPANCWVGVTAETRKLLEIRKAHLLACDAVVKFVSVEPVRGEFLAGDFDGLDWVIVGKETGGRKPRGLDHEVRSVIDRCCEAGVPVFAKRNTGLDGPREWPEQNKEEGDGCNS